MIREKIRHKKVNIYNECYDFHEYLTTSATQFTQPNPPHSIASDFSPLSLAKKCHELTYQVSLHQQQQKQHHYLRGTAECGFCLTCRKLINYLMPASSLRAERSIPISAVGIIYLQSVPFRSSILLFAIFASIERMNR